MNIKPIKDYVHVKRDPTKEITDGGIYIPEIDQQVQNSGTVVTIGPDVKELSPGDKVIFIWSAGFDIRTDDVEYNTELLMRESDVMGIIP